MRNVAITGASGFVGQSLTQHFKAQGLEVFAIQRGQLQDIESLTQIIEKSDIVINLAGANIINRWSEEYKKLLYSSRIDTTKNLIKAFEKAQHKPKLFISTSAVGIYNNAQTHNENSTQLGDDFLANLCKDWERTALEAQEIGIRTAIFRFGIVLGSGGGALQKMITPFKLGVGGTIGDGTQAFSFIHIDDLIHAYDFVMTHKNLDGVFNLTAPNPTTNHGLTKALGQSLHRPTFLPVPTFMLNLIFSEGAKVLTDGQSAIPQKLLDNGFEFSYKNINDTIEALVG
jgi:uncharacterized protein (TIGR01777 family)